MLPLVVVMLLPELLLLRRKFCKGVSFLPDPITDEIFVLLLAALPANIEEEGCCCFLKASLVLLLLVLVLLMILIATLFIMFLLLLLTLILITLGGKGAGDGAASTSMGVGDKGVIIPMCCRCCNCWLIENGV